MGFLQEALARRTEPCSGASLLLPGEPGAPRPARIIVVDDDPEFLEIASALLQDPRWTVATFTSPLRALAQLRKAAPDLALIDLLMPGMDGFACANQIRRRRPETAILLVTGVRGAMENHPHHNSTAYGVLYKPFHRDELRKYVEDALHGLRILSSPPGLTATDRREAFIRAKNLDQPEVLALDALAASKLYKQIAEEQGWSEALTHKIIHNAFLKLNVHTCYAAAMIWYENTR